MDLIRWNKLYETNKKLDNIFLDKYKNDHDLFYKNKIELLVEIGEFINETKVFKYWSNKKIDKGKELDEYADVIIMILSFYNFFYMDIEHYYIDINEDDLLLLFQEIYKSAINFIEDDSEKELETLFKYVLYVGTLLEFKEDEVIKAIEEKQNIIENRLNSDY